MFLLMKKQIIYRDSENPCPINNKCKFTVKNAMPYNNKFLIYFSLLVISFRVQLHKTIHLGNWYRGRMSDIIFIRLRSAFTLSSRSNMQVSKLILGKNKTEWRKLNQYRLFWNRSPFSCLNGSNIHSPLTTVNQGRVSIQTRVWFKCFCIKQVAFKYITPGN